MSELPIKTEAEHEAAMVNLSCPHLENKGCSVYDDRPIICRLFGTTPKLLCPHGRRPDELIDPLIEAEINQFFLSARKVLV